ncbi:Cro/Cl family transcriptional regulator [Rubrivivax sp. A210]|uniref:helix-turn-helix domain-containing protein n=1 Tax=Rubrivivax sp. A210 TaxID=2772301 RepID=UPI001917D32C|nr:helix-turn-helix transcriptional regulator [Rubrivivax sp. A210]CAD5371669.1 Cro/Cl family transcriptional regulator [Rubrivivax sp. A210]
MSSSQDLVAVLKAELRRAGITYAQLAAELGLAESSVKRIFARGDMPLSRIDEVLAVLKLDFAELARQVALASPARQQLTPEQEAAVVADPKLLLAAICVLSQWTLEQMVQTYTLSKPQGVACLLALDRLGIIELRANNRYRLRVDKTFRWLPNGPVMDFFRRHAMGDYFDGGFDGNGEMLTLVHGQISPAHAALFNDRLQRLAHDFAQQHLADQKLPPAERQAFTLVIGMRSWLFAPFRALLRPGA